MSRFKFTIRDMIFVVVIVALLLGWGIERVRSQRLTARAQQARAIADYERAMAFAKQAQAAMPTAPSTP
jgi:cytochrome b